SLLAFLVLAFSLILAGILVITPRAPVRLLFPMILFCWWVGPGLAFPLGQMPAEKLPLALAALQILLAGWLWVRWHRRGTGFLPFAVNARRPVFAWRHALLAGPAVAVL